MSIARKPGPKCLKPEACAARYGVHCRGCNIKARWENPEYRAKRVAQMKLSAASRSTSSTAEERAEAVRLRLEGYDYAFIARKLGRSEPWATYVTRSCEPVQKVAHADFLVQGKTAAEAIRSAIAYSPETGALVWHERDPSHVSSRSFNSNFAGKPATSKVASGHLFVRFLGKRYPAAVIAWMHYYGVWPEGFVDHVNGKPADNRISNLRQATPSENNCNRGRQRNNKSGYKGVCFVTKYQKFMASISKDRTTHFLGYFASAEEAFSAYQAAAVRLHGSFANWDGHDV